MLMIVPDSRLRALQLGCFQYFQAGGECIDGPVGLLSGIVRRPFVLFYHFFAVAVLAIWIFIGSQPVWKLPLTLVESAAIFAKACVVLFPYAWSEIQS